MSPTARRQTWAAVALVALAGTAACPLRCGSEQEHAQRRSRSEAVPGDVDTWFSLAARARRGGPKADRERALAVYRTIVRDFPAHPRAGEAAFRAGEVLRALERFDESDAWFARAEALDRSGAFDLRARLERGHVERRRERWQRALAHYTNVFGNVRGSARWRDEAAFWAGKTEALQQRQAAARTWFEWVATEARDPALRVRAHDEWMLGYIADGDLEAAAGVLARARVDLAQRLGEHTETGERVRRAFDNMRALTALERAVRARCHGH